MISSPACFWARASSWWISSWNSGGCGKTTLCASSWPMRSALIPAAYGICRPTRSWTRTVSAAIWAAWSKPIAKWRGVWESCPNPCKAKTKVRSWSNESACFRDIEEWRARPAGQGDRPCPERAGLWRRGRCAPRQGDRPGIARERRRQGQSLAQRDVRKASGQHGDREIRDRDQMKKLAAAILMVAFSVAAASAQDAAPPAPAMPQLPNVDPERLALAQKILAETHTQDNISAMIDTMLPTIVAGFRRQSPNLPEGTYKMVGQMLADEMRKELPP